MFESQQTVAILAQAKLAKKQSLSKHKIKGEVVKATMSASVELLKAVQTASMVQKAKVAKEVEEWKEAIKAQEEKVKLFGTAQSKNKEGTVYRIDVKESSFINMRMKDNGQPIIARFKGNQAQLWEANPGKREGKWVNKDWKLVQKHMRDAKSEQNDEELTKYLKDELSKATALQKAIDKEAKANEDLVKKQIAEKRKAMLKEQDSRKKAQDEKEKSWDRKLGQLSKLLENVAEKGNEEKVEMTNFIKELRKSIGSSSSSSSSSKSPKAKAKAKAKPKAKLANSLKRKAAKTVTAAKKAKN